VRYRYTGRREVRYRYTGRREVRYRYTGRLEKSYCPIVPLSYCPNMFTSLTHAFVLANGFSLFV
ncbi:MAG: hypothetical protein ACE5PV_15480, partial [Candidatus Poribacteria bacterium]